MLLYTSYVRFVLTTGGKKYSLPFDRDSTDLTTLFSSWVIIVVAILLLKRKAQERLQYKTECAEYITKLHKKQRKLSYKNKFIATLTHEMRNIVTRYITFLPHFFSILTNASIIKKNMTWDEELVTELFESSKALSEMLTNTLDISKLEEGKIEFNTCYEPIEKVIDLALSINKANAKKKEIKVSTSYSRFLPPLVEIDKSRLSQIITNLLSNAIKFTTEKGKVLTNIKWLWNCAKESGDCGQCDGAIENFGQPLKVKKQINEVRSLGAEGPEMMFQPAKVEGRVALKKRILIDRDLLVDSNTDEETQVIPDEHVQKSRTITVPSKSPVVISFPMYINSPVDLKVKTHQFFMNEPKLSKKSCPPMTEENQRVSGFLFIPL